MALNVKFKEGTKEQYDSIVRDPKTFYLVDEKDLYLGDNKLNDTKTIASTT